MRVDDSLGFKFIAEEHAQRLRNANVQRGDIIFTHRGTIGQVSYVPVKSAYDRYVVSQSQFYLRCDRRLAVPQFITYYFKTHEGRHLLLANTSQVGVPSIAQPVSYLRSLSIPLPSLEEQRAIVHILETLDDKIELNRRMGRTLEAMARALYTSWFVDFEPVRAKMAGRDSALPRHLADLFPTRLVDSGSGAIPHGWETSEIGKEVKIIGGATPSTKEPAYWDQGTHHWATPKDLSSLSSPVLLETGRKITAAGVRKIASGVLPAGTVLLSSRAPIGYLAIAAVPAAVNQGFIAMVCDRRLPNLYVLFWCYRNLDYVRGIAGGSTFAEISKRAFRPLPVIVPPAPLLAGWIDLVRPLYDRMVASARQCAPLTGMRDLMLRQLMSGRIRISDAENALEAVT